MTWDGSLPSQPGQRKPLEPAKAWKLDEPAEASPVPSAAALNITNQNKKRKKLPTLIATYGQDRHWETRSKYRE